MVAGTDAIDRLTGQLGSALVDAGRRLAVAESCTGGGLAYRLTQVPGASDWFDRGFVTYSNGAKSAMLGVSQGLIATHGAVSEPVALAMAEGALANSGVDLAVAVTGIAGPGGERPGKPVGTVFIAMAGGGRSVCRRYGFSGDRETVRQQSIEAALAALLEWCEVLKKA